MDEVFSHIRTIGNGDFSEAIPVNAGSENSVLGWLSETQARLNALNRERLRAEAASRQNDQRFRATFEQAAVGVAHVDLEGRFLVVNQRYADIVGRTREELMGCTFQQITHPEDLSTDLGHLGRLLKGAIATYSMEKRYVRKDASLVWVNLTVSLVRDDAFAPMYFIAVVEDISLRKRTQAQVLELNASLEQRVADRTAELQAANKDMEAFSYSVSHDLRAPLRGMNGFSEALLEDYAGQLDARGQDYLGRIGRAAQNMGKLIDDLLALSRVTRSEMTFDAVDLGALARKVIAELQPLQAGRAVEWEIGDPLRGRGDARLLGLVLVNLLANALKFTGEREHARIEFGERAEGAERVFFVRDNGAGFDMAHAGRLFGAFQRLHSVQEFPGTGIGLATVQRIIRRHGGRVWAEGQPGKGATFFFTLSTGAPS